MCTSELAKSCIVGKTAGLRPAGNVSCLLDAATCVTGCLTCSSALHSEGQAPAETESQAKYMARKA